MKSSLLLYQEQISHFKSPSLSNKTINISTISHQSPNGSLSVKLFPPKGNFAGSIPRNIWWGACGTLRKVCDFTYSIDLWPNQLSIISCLRLMTLKIINEGLLGMVINNDENEINKHMLECKTHTLFMAKMAKIDHLFMSNTTFFSVQVKRDIAIFRAWA